MTVSLAEIISDYEVEDSIEAELDERLEVFDRPYPPFYKIWFSRAGLLTLLAVAAIIAGIFVLPNGLFEPETRTITYTLGFLAVWRYSWWLTHAIRSNHFAKTIYPNMRKNADAVWASGWRPRKMHFMMTTFYEEPEITRRVIDGILDQIDDMRVDAHIWIGTGTGFDEKIISEHVATLPDRPNTEVTFVRQNQPGKRMAIGTVLRAIRRSGAGSRDLVVFLDGDAIMKTGCLKKCASIFGADPDLAALTTDEDVVCFGPGWMQRWLRMRFAQRRVAMQSHAVSGKVLTLTGRMSVFRGDRVLTPRLIRTVEADTLDHWLWGRFRFLSGDDKSTWFYMLTQSAKMTYVPDALVITVEVIKGSGTQRMVFNLKRWSGNMLRNGWRAISLGPRKTGGFIWWCLVDQRLAIWTTLVSPILAIYGCLLYPAYIVTALLWILATRTLLSLYLFRWAREPDPYWPVLLYINQVLNAAVKFGVVFRLSRQAWTNRGNQRAIFPFGWVRYAQISISNWQFTTSLAAFLWGMALWSGFASLPTIH